MRRRHRSRRNSQATCGRNLYFIGSHSVGGRNRRPSQHDLSRECSARLSRLASALGDCFRRPRLVPAITQTGTPFDGYSMHPVACLLAGSSPTTRRLPYFHVNDADGNLAHMPEGMDPAEPASPWFQPASTQLSWAGVEFMTPSLVIGIGPVGLMSVAGAALHGASCTIAVGTWSSLLRQLTDFIPTRMAQSGSRSWSSICGKGVGSRLVNDAAAARPFEDASRHSSLAERLVTSTTWVWRLRQYSSRRVVGMGPRRHPRPCAWRPSTVLQPVTSGRLDLHPEVTTSLSRLITTLEEAFSPCDAQLTSSSQLLLMT